MANNFDNITTAPAFINALCALLKARAGLSGVTVSSGPLADDKIKQSIEFDEIEAAQNWAALGQLKRKEDYSVTGWIFVVSSGANEAAITACRERAYTIFAELVQALWDDPTVSQTVLTASLERYHLEQVITAGKLGNARGAAIDFSISVTAQLKRN